MSRLGASLEVVGNGQLAVDAALASPPDLVLMDMQMPVMDGLTAVQTLRARGYQGAIVAFTANATREDRQAFLDAGCHDFLTKPVVRSRFEEVVHRYLACAAPNSDPAGIGAELFVNLSSAEPQYPQRVNQFSSRLSQLRPQFEAAALGADLHELTALARELRTAGNQFTCTAATRLGGQLEFAATAQSHESVRRLMGRLNALCERADAEAKRDRVASLASHKPAAPDADGPIASELLEEGSDMSDLVHYVLGRLPQYLARLQEAMQARDFASIKRCAHDMKSVGGGYGYPMMFELAKEMEATAASNDEVRLLGLIEDFAALARRIQLGAPGTAGCLEVPAARRGGLPDQTGAPG